MNNITDKIRAMLAKQGICYRQVEHAPATTCQSAAQLRGTELKIGGKTILLKDKQDYRLFVLSAALRIDSRKVRRILGSKYLRYATPSELEELCGVSKGALPPLGRDLYPYDLYLDESILANEFIAFNAGVLTISFILRVEDYLRLVDPIICSFSRP